MAFVAATRLVQFADTVGGVPAVLASPVTVQTWNGEVVQTIAAAVALLPQGQRPAVGDYWKYMLQWQVRGHVVPTVRGVMPGTGTLVFDGDCWESITDTGSPPVARNTWLYQFTAGRITGNVGQDLNAAITAFLFEAGMNGWVGDRRDPNRAAQATTDPAQDPLGLLASAAVQAFAAQAVNLPATWTPSVS